MYFIGALKNSFFLFRSVFYFLKIVKVLVFPVDELRKTKDLKKFKKKGLSFTANLMFHTSRLTPPFKVLVREF